MQKKYMENIEALLKKLVEGSITPAEESFFFEWLHENKDEWSLRYYEIYRRLLEQKVRLLPEERSALLLKSIHARIQVRDRLPVPDDIPRRAMPAPDHNRSGRRKIGWYLAVAASFVLLLTAARYYWVSTSGKGAAPQDHALASDGSLRKVVNSKKILIPIALSDGSSVLLYPKSSLVYKEEFGTGNRDVFLEGKAFFEVTRNPDQPFLVHANEMITRVLGTSFMVEAYSDHPRFMVSVKTGQVAVSAAGSGETNAEDPAAGSVALKENEETTFDRSLRAFAVPAPDISRPVVRNIPRTSAEYRFREVPVMDIFARLSQDYGVAIRADKATLANCSLTATLKDKPLFEKLRVICETIGPGTSFEIEEGIVIVNSLGCNN